MRLLMLALCRGCAESAASHNFLLTRAARIGCSLDPGTVSSSARQRSSGRDRTADSRFGPWGEAVRLPYVRAQIPPRGAQRRRLRLAAATALLRRVRRSKDALVRASAQDHVSRHFRPAAEESAMECARRRFRELHRFKPRDDLENGPPQLKGTCGEIQSLR